MYIFFLKLLKIYYAVSSKTIKVYVKLWYAHFLTRFLKNDLGCRQLCLALFSCIITFILKEMFWDKRLNQLKSASFYFSSIIMTSDMYWVSFVSMENSEQNSDRLFQNKRKISICTMISNLSGQPDLFIGPGTLKTIRLHQQPYVLRFWTIWICQNLGVPWHPRHPQGRHPCIGHSLL